MKTILLIALLLLATSASAEKKDYLCVFYTSGVVACQDKKTKIVWTVNPLFFIANKTRVEA